MCAKNIAVGHCTGCANGIVWRLFSADEMRRNLSPIILLTSVLFVFNAQAFGQSADLLTQNSLAGGSATPSEGDIVSFSISVTNNGPDVASNVSLNSNLPAGLNATANNGLASQGTFLAGNWDIGDLSNGAAATLTLEGSVESGQAGSTITLLTTAAVADQADPDTSGDDLTESVTVQSLTADLVTLKSLASGEPLPMQGATVTYTIDVANNGPGVATNVTLNDLLPPGLAATSNNGVVSQGSYGAGVWSLGELASGSSASLTLEGTIASCQPDQTITNTTAAAVASEIDPTTAGDLLTQQVIVTGSAETPINNWLLSRGGVSASGNQIRYSGSPTGWINNGINSVSMATLGYTDDYEVRFTIDSNPAQSVWVIGLGVTETDFDWRDVDHALRGSNGTFQVYESGSWRKTGPTLQLGDVVSIYKNGTTLEYRLNGDAIHTRSVPAAQDFYIDSSFKSGAITLSASVFSGSASPEPPDPSPGVAPINDWFNLTGGVAASGNTLSYPGTPLNWNRNTANSALLSTYGANGEFEIEWTVSGNPTGTTWIVGLGVVESSPGFTDVDYGLRSSSGSVYAFENGTSVAAGGRLANGDTLGIRVTGTALSYLHNGGVFHSRGIGGGEAFYIDTSFKKGVVALTSFTFTNLAPPDPDPGDGGSSGPVPGGVGGECDASPGNTPPGVTAGSNQVVTEGTTVTLVANGADVDGDVLSYLWTLISKPPGSSLQLLTPNDKTLFVTPDAIGEYVFEVISHDGREPSVPATVALTVNPVPPPTPVSLHIPFSEGSGDFYWDVAQNIEYELQSGEQWVPGKFANFAVRLNPQSAVPLSLSAPTDQATQTFSLLAWVKPLEFDPDEDYAADNIVLSGADLASADFQLSLRNDAAHRFAFAATLDSVEHVLRSNTVPVPNAWYHIAVTYDGANIHLYINGELDAELTASGTLDGAANAFQVGRLAPGSGLDAELDDLRFYGATLPAQEISDFYTAAEYSATASANYSGALQECANIDVSAAVFQSGPQGYTSAAKTTLNSVFAPIGDGISLYVPDHRIPAAAAGALRLS